MIVVFQFKNKSSFLAHVLFCVQHHLEEVALMLLIGGQQTFSIKSQIVTILGFASRAVSAETAAVTQNSHKQHIN